MKRGGCCRQQSVRVCSPSMCVCGVRYGVHGVGVGGYVCMSGACVCVKHDSRLVGFG